MVHKVINETNYTIVDVDKISYPINIEDQFGPPSDDENEQTIESTDKLFVDAASTDAPEQNHGDPLIELGPVCNHADLKKDVAFVNENTRYFKQIFTSSYCY